MPKLRISVSDFLFWMVTFSLTLGLFLPAFSSCFFQDDWCSFSISHATSVKDFGQFFWPRTDVIYYRPLGMQVPFFLLRSLFGLTTWPFRTLTMVLHLVNGILVYELLRHFLKAKIPAQLGAFFYLTAAVHWIIFYWAATFAFVLGPTFYLSSLVSFLNKKYGLSLILFALGLLTNEFLLTLPVIISLWMLLFSKLNLRYLVKMGCIASFYILIRFGVAHVPVSGSYALTLSPTQLVLNLRNYLLWSFNWPDEIQNQFVTMFKLNSQFVTNFSREIRFWLVNLVLFISFFAVVPLSKIFRDRKSQKDILKIVLFGGLWYMITLAPVLFFEGHAFSYYLVLPLIGLLLAALILAENWLQREKQTSLVYVCLLFACSAWYVSAFRTTRLNTYIHWAPRRAKIAQQIISKAQSQYPTVEPNSVVIVPENSEYMWALGDQNALQVIYGDTSIATFYGSSKSYQKSALAKQKVYQLQLSD